MDALRAASDRCEAVLCLISPDWLKSRWCMTEFLLARSLHKRILAAVVAPVALDALPVEMTAEWQLCELVGADRHREFVMAEATVSFREAGLDLLRRGLERAGLDSRGFVWPPPGDPDRAPYRGLRALEAEDAAIFFGRDAAVIRGMDQLRGMAELGVDRLMLVLGASGAGKSSFLRAGLWPLLARDDAHFLPLPVIRPLDAVISGSAGLAVSLSGAFARLGVARPPGPVKAALASGGAAALAAMLDELADLSRARLVHVEAGGRPPTVVLPVDQAEELFNSEGAAEAESFLSLFASVLNGPCRVLVVWTIRTDRYHRVQSEALLPGVRRVLFDLSPIPASDYRQVIEGPVRIMQAGSRKFAIDPALTERLIADATGADALPLLAFTLERLWADYGAHGRLTLNDYVSMGGVQGSIEAAVAGALARPDQAPAIPADTAAQNTALRAAFIPWLARVDPATRQALRRPARMEDIPGPSRAVVDRFVAARLLLADRRDGVDVIEVAHESLLRQWPRLVAWLDADAADLAQMEEVERAASEWARNGRRDEWLDHRADRLTAAEGLLRRADFLGRLGEVGAAYVVAARVLAERERTAREVALAKQARTQRYVWWALSAVGVVLAIGILGTVHFTRQLYARQAALDVAIVNRMADIASAETAHGNMESALRIGVLATRRAMDLGGKGVASPLPAAQLGATLWQSNCRIVLGGHHSEINSAVFSLDGSRIVTASSDGVARVWEAASGRELTKLHGHRGLVSFASFSPDGTNIITASFDKTARLWDAVSGRQISVLNSGDMLSWAKFDPSGKRIIAAPVVGPAQFWDPSSRQKVGSPVGHRYEKFHALSADGSHYITGDLDGTAWVSETATGRQILSLGHHGDQVDFATFSSDGARLLTVAARTARIWDAASGRQLAMLDGHSGKVRSAVFSQDGSLVVTASEDATARIWDSTSGRQVMALVGHTKPVSFAAFSPDGTRVVTASIDGTARIWDISSHGAAVVLKGHTDEIRSASYSPDGRYVLTGSNDSTARIWDPMTGRQVALLAARTSLEAGSKETTNVLNDARFSHDARHVALAAGDWTTRIWQVSPTREVALLHGHEGPVFSAQFSPDDKHVLTASKDQTVRIWDAITGNEIGVTIKYSNWINSATFSPDGTKILLASSDGTAQVWDSAGRNRIVLLKGHEASVISGRYSLDGTRIVTASYDKTARIWDARSGNQLILLSGHLGPVFAANFNLDGTRVVTGSADGTARIWDTASGKQIAVLYGHTDGVGSADFSPDGTHVVTASADQSARIWDVRDAAMSAADMVKDTCTHRLRGISRLTAAEVASIGEVSLGRIDVCAEQMSRP